MEDVITPHEMITLACRALFAPGQIVELRVLSIDQRIGRNAVGWFDDIDKLIEAATLHDQQNAAGIYTTLNPVHPDCLARCCNRIKDWSKSATADKDVMSRFWLPIDIDPRRLTGISSSNNEVEYARDKTKAIVSWLEGELGLPPGIRAFSGNGIHLLYRIDMPNDATARHIITCCLKVIDDKFSDPQVKIDIANNNAARIFKLYGTIARKGDSTAERPHRRSALWKTQGQYPVFKDVKVITDEQLASIIESGGRTYSTAAATLRTPKTRRSETYFDLDKFITDNSLPIVKKETWPGGIKYILAHCLFDESHVGTSAMLGRTQAGAIFYKCQHDSCVGKGWKEVKEMFRKSIKKNRYSSQAPSVTQQSGQTASDDPWVLARLMVDENYLDPDFKTLLLRRHRGTFFLYDKKRHAYTAITDRRVRVEITRWLGGRVEKVTIRKVSDICNSLEAIVTVPDELEPPFISRIDAETGCSTGDPRRLNRMVMTNGIIDVDGMIDGQKIGDCLLPHSSEWFTTISLPFPFPTKEDQLECPSWTVFLKETFADDETRIAVLQEAFGYCFFLNASMETFFVLYGRGRNGKSTVMNILAIMLGEENVCSLTLEQLAGRNFLAMLYGKLANLCADMNEVAKVEEGILKAIVSGDSITADRKYVDPITFKPITKMFFSTNVLPRFVDTSIGIWRRMTLIPFDYIVPIDRVDIHLIDKLEQEMPAIMHWALQGARRLKETQRFTYSKKCQVSVAEYRRQCFPILMFLEECTQRKESIVARDLWKWYKNWCDTCGLQKPKPLHQFVKDVVGFATNIQYTKPTAGLEANMVLYGLSIRPGLDLETIPVDPDHDVRLLGGIT